jgi:hypothetical protein
MENAFLNNIAVCARCLQTERAFGDRICEIR